MLNSSRQLFGYTKDDLAVETLTLDNGILSCDITSEKQSRKKMQKVVK